MNVIQYFLGKIAEETAELAQRALKAQQFGLEEKQEGQELNNLQRMLDEYLDLIVTVEFFVTHQDLGVSTRPDNSKTLDRKSKMREYLALSKSLGQCNANIEI